uniref:Uncharacterized protein n=1 Tax=Arundo donax TaxID=35708 RepID=A0A0A9AIA9_ARUDO
MQILNIALVKNLPFRSQLGYSIVVLDSVFLMSLYLHPAG